MKPYIEISICTGVESQFIMNLTFSIVGLVQGGEGHVKAYSIDFLLCLYIISGPALWQYCKQHRLMKSYTFICVTFSTVFQCGSWDTNVKLLHNFLLLAMAQTRSKIGFMTFPHKTKGKHFPIRKSTHWR